VLSNLKYIYWNCLPFHEKYQTFIVYFDYLLITFSFNNNIKKAFELTKNEHFFFKIFLIWMYLVFSIDYLANEYFLWIIWPKILVSTQTCIWAKRLLQRLQRFFINSMKYIKFEWYDSLKYFFAPASWTHHSNDMIIT